MGALPDISPYLPNQVSRNPLANITTQIQTPPVPPAFAPQRTIDRVKGQEGAQNFNIGPNSSVLVLDEDLNVVWVIATDQNGNKSLVKGFYLGDEYIPPKPVTMEDLMSEMRDMKNRMIKLEEEASNGKHDQQSAGQSEPGNAGSQTSKRNSTESGIRQSAWTSESAGSKNESSS